MALIKKRFWELEKKNVFQNPLYFEKSNLALVGPNLHSRTILQKQISFICMKAPKTEWVPHLDDYRPTLFMHKLLFTAIITWWLWKHNNSDLVTRWLCVYDSQTLGQPLEVGGQWFR